MELCASSSELPLSIFKCSPRAKIFFDDWRQIGSASILIFQFPAKNLQCDCFHFRPNGNARGESFNFTSCVRPCTVWCCLSYKDLEMKNANLQYRNRLCNIEANSFSARHKTERRIWHYFNFNATGVSCKSTVQQKHTDTSTNKNIKHTMSIQIQWNRNMQSNEKTNWPPDKILKQAKKNMSLLQWKKTLEDETKVL